MKCTKHLVISDRTHERIMIYKLHNGFKSIDKLLSYWLDSVEKEEDTYLQTLRKDMKEGISYNEN